MTEDDAKNLEEVSEQVKEDMPVVAGPDDSPETAEAVAEEERPKPKRTRKKPAAKKDEAPAEETEEPVTE